MEWFLAILAVAVITVAAVAGSGRLGQFGSSATSRPDLILPNRVLTSDDIHSVRFGVVPRGYAMNQVDELLSRLEHQLRPVAPQEDIAMPVAATVEPKGEADTLRDDVPPQMPNEAHVDAQVGDSDHIEDSQARIVGSDDAQQGRNNDGSDEATHG